MRTRQAMLLAALLTLAGVTAAAQDEEDPGLWERLQQWREERIAVTDTYRVSSTGAAYGAFQDTRMTPMVYRSVAFAAFTQGRTYRPREIVIADAYFQIGTPTPQGLFPLGMIVNPHGTVDLAYLRRFSDVPLAVGGGVSVAGTLRQAADLANSAFNLDVLVSLSPTARWEDEFTLLGRPTSWHVAASLPLVSWALRDPAYNISYGGAVAFWAAPWDLYRVRLSAGLSRLLTRSEENRFEVIYRYDLYGHEDESTAHVLTVGSHSLTLGYALKTR